LQIGRDMLHIITSTGDGLFTFINIDDLKLSWTSKRSVLVNFSWFRPATHILRVNCFEMAGDRQHAYEIFSIRPKRRFQQSKLSPTMFKCSRRPTQAGDTDRYSPPLLKVVILPLLARLAWNQLQIDTCSVSTSDELFNGVNTDDIKWP